MLSPIKLSAVIVLVLVAVTGCNRGPVSNLKSQQEADNAVVKIANLTEVPFNKMLQQAPLETEDKENLKLALPIARDLVAYNPSSRNYAAILGKTLIGLGETSEARSILRNALNSGATAQSDVDALVMAGMLADLAEISFNEQKYDLALDDVRQATILAPNDPHFLTLTARIYIQKNDPQEALVYANKALEVDPGYIPASQLIKLIELASAPTED